MSGRRIAVVGGGVIGLACAWRLAAAGAAVVLLDGAAEAREASWAAAGMLAPHHEAEAADDRWRLGIASLEAWPGFARDLAAAAPGHDLDLRLDGGLAPAADAAEADRERARLARLDAGAWLDPAAARAAEPGLAADLAGAALLPGGSVDPRRLAAALAAACARAGVELRYGVAATGLAPGAVLTADGPVACDLAVLASGAWTPVLARLSGIDLPGEPVKGQMLRLAAPAGLPRRFLHCAHAYVVPRVGGGAVIGSTMVESGFDRSQDPAAIARLAAGAGRLLPALAGAAVVETWTGLRPRLRGGRPLIARLRDNLVVATGHFRNGILLTPITAAAVADLAAGRAPAPAARPFAAPPAAAGSDGAGPAAR